MARKIPDDEICHFDPKLYSGDEQAMEMFWTLARDAMERHRIWIALNEGMKDDGWFIWEPPSSPYIKVAYGQDGPTDVRETISLAHELGHFQSWREEVCGDEVFFEMHKVVAGTPLPLRKARLEEERRAWTYGRAILGAVSDFVSWDLYETMETTAVEGYKSGLRLPDGA